MGPRTSVPPIRSSRLSTCSRPVWGHRMPVALPAEAWWSLRKPGAVPHSLVSWGVFLSCDLYDVGQSHKPFIPREHAVPEWSEHSIHSFIMCFLRTQALTLVLKIRALCCVQLYMAPPTVAASLLCPHKSQINRHILCPQTHRLENDTEKESLI